MARNDGLELPENPFIQITLQDGPIREVGTNGCQIDDVVKWSIDVLEQLNAKFPCLENKYAIEDLKTAAAWLEARRVDRERRGVEGANLS